VENVDNIEKLRDAEELHRAEVEELRAHFEGNIVV
jgi:hypothetical protein